MLLPIACATAAVTGCYLSALPCGKWSGNNCVRIAFFRSSAHSLFFRNKNAAKKTIQGLGAIALAPERYDQARQALARNRYYRMGKRLCIHRDHARCLGRSSCLLPVLSLSAGTPYIDPAGYYIIEFNGYYWRRVVVRIRIIGIARTGSGSGKEKHQTENRSAQEPMSQQEHFRLNPLEITWADTAQKGDTGILAEG